MIKAVIFDMDGTLVDTEKYFRINWPKAFAFFGYTMTDREALSIRSLGKPFVQEYLKKVSGDENFDYEAVKKIRNQYMEESLEQNGLHLKKGAVEFLEFLKEKGIVRAVATASPADRAERCLKKVGILEYFDRIFSASMVNEGKPSPDVYAFSVNQLNLKPEECLAVEDSPNGVTSAFRAGCRVAMIPDQTPPDENTKKLLFALKDSLDQLIGIF